MNIKIILLVLSQFPSVACHDFAWGHTALAIIMFETLELLQSKILCHANRYSKVHPKSTVVV